MATFGQGINPQLGAIDYSPILKGSMAGAQMAAQGSQNIGQGLANLGQELGAGLKKRGEYKAEVTAALKTADLINTTADLPDGVKKLAASAKLQLNDPNLSLREQAAIGSRMNGMFGGVMQAGLTTAMKDPNTKALEDLQLATGRQALASRKAQEEGWAKAVQASTIDGKLDLNTLATNAFNSGVTDIGELSRLMQTVGAVNFKPSLVQITGEDGKTYTAMTTGVGTAAQVKEPTPLRPLRPTAMEDRERVSKLLAEAVEKKDWAKVAMYSTALQTPGIFGGNASASEVQRSFAAPSGSSTTAAPGGGVGLDTSASSRMPAIPKPETPVKYNEQEINDAKTFLANHPEFTPDKVKYYKNKYGLQ